MKLVLLAGRVLLFNSMLIAILILRNLITALRELGLTTVLPLDNNIYLHKVVGYLIFVQAWIHSIMHLCNFCESSQQYSRTSSKHFVEITYPFSDINIQPDPVKFVQLTTKYWEPFGEMRPGYMNLDYAPPEGCNIANVTADPDFAAKVCAPDSLDVNATAGKLFLILLPTDFI